MMLVTRGLPRLGAICLYLTVLVSAASAQEGTGPSVSTALYVRQDSDKTTVVTPRLRVGAQATEQTRLDLVYTVDVWSSASVDIRSAATRKVVEQRDEIDASVAHQIGSLNLGGSYRYSTENDYESHGGSLGASLDLAQKNTNLSLTGRAYIDKVWAAGDPHQKWDTSTMTLRASATQNVDADTFVQLVYEITRQAGYLSSPYRFVRFVQQKALDDGTPLDATTCANQAGRTLLVHCERENNPKRRLRHAVAVYGRHALSWPLSVGFNYRFYRDDWGLSAHTAGLDGAFTLDDTWLFSAGYRMYFQGDAKHYRPYYGLSPDSTARYYTSDKELSALSSHRLDLELTHTAALDNEGTTVKTVLLAAPTYYSFQNFPLLKSITALEVTLSVEVQL